MASRITARPTLNCSASFRSEGECLAGTQLAAGYEVRILAATS